MNNNNVYFLKLRKVLIICNNYFSIKYIFNNKNCFYIFLKFSFYYFCCDKKLVLLQLYVKKNTCNFVHKLFF